MRSDPEVTYTMGSLGEPGSTNAGTVVSGPLPGNHQTSAPVVALTAVTFPSWEPKITRSFARTGADRVAFPTAEVHEELMNVHTACPVPTSSAARTSEQFVVPT